MALDHPHGNHDGRVDGEKYFVAKPRHGVFCREDKIVPQSDGIEGTVFFYPQYLTGRLLRFDIRAEALRPFGFRSGDKITATHSKYKGQGKIGSVIGVRHGLLYWNIEGVAGACACKNTAEETIDTFKKKKYRKVGSEELKNYLDDLTTADQSVLQMAVPSDGISREVLAKVSHLVKPEGEKWEGKLVSPTPAEGYQSWLKKLWRKKKIDQAVAQS